MRYQSLYLSLCLAAAGVTAACRDGVGPAAPVLAPPAGARAAASNGGGPSETGFDLVTDELCPGISLHLEVSGKTKTLTAGPGGALAIILSPGQEARLTNLSTGKPVTLSISGAFHQTVRPNGDVVTVITGQNLTYDPVAPIHFALTDGVFSYVLDAVGNLVEPRDGKGRIVDVCTLIA